MRIGMMVDIYKPHVSGVTNHIALTKQHLEKLGHDVFVFTFGDSDYKDDEKNVIRSSGIPIVAPVIKEDVHINVGYNRRARKLLHSMDIVHLHHPFISGTMAMRYCKPRGIPIVFTNHTRYDLYYQAYLPMLPESLGDAFLQAYLPSFFRRCDLVIAPSPGMRDVLTRYGNKTPLEVILNGVDLKPIRAEKNVIKRETLGYKQDDIILLYVGRLGPEKNLNFLIRAFAGTAEAYGQTRLLLVGDGYDRGNLEDRVQHMGINHLVRFEGVVPYDELPRYLHLADAFVTASISEVHPLTVIEAMAAGLPVLGIKSPGVADTVEDGVTGFIARDDLAAFTAKMVRLVTENKLRRELGENAFNEANKYAIDRTSKILLDRYKLLVDEAAFRKNKLGVKFINFIDRLGSKI